MSSNELTAARAASTSLADARMRSTRSAITQRVWKTSSRRSAHSFGALDEAGLHEPFCDAPAPVLAAWRELLETFGERVVRCTSPASVWTTAAPSTRCWMTQTSVISTTTRTRLELARRATLRPHGDARRLWRLRWAACDCVLG